MATVTETLLTAEEFARTPDPGYPTELVRGRVIEMSPPKPIHGWICNRIAYLITHFLMKNDVGQAFSNDTGVITERDPDTLRGADYSYYSYERVPKETSRRDYFDAAPDLIFEVMSQGDHWPTVMVKVAEYLHVGVRAVCVVEPGNNSIHLYQPEERLQVFGFDEVWEVPEILPGLSLPVRKFFE